MKQADRNNQVQPSKQTGMPRYARFIPNFIFLFPEASTYDVVKNDLRFAGTCTLPALQQLPCHHQGMVNLSLSPVKMGYQMIPLSIYWIHWNSIEAPSWQYTWFIWWLVIQLSCANMKTSTPKPEVTIRPFDRRGQFLHKKPSMVFLVKNMLQESLKDLGIQQKEASIDWSLCYIMAHGNQKYSNQLLL